MDFSKITKLARKRWRQIIADQRVEGLIMPLTHYLCEADYLEICDDELSWQEHTAFMALFAEIAGRRGAIPILVPILPELYFKYLRERKTENSPQTRARYVTELTTGVDPPQSKQFNEV